MNTKKQKLNIHGVSCNKRKPRHVHYAANGYDQHFKPFAVCGKRYLGWMRTVFSRDPNEVTCVDCINHLKETIYHCQEHGFLEGSDVRNDETCDYCGGELNVLA